MLAIPWNDVAKVKEIHATVSAGKCPCCVRPLVAKVLVLRIDGQEMVGCVDCTEAADWVSSSPIPVNPDCQTKEALIQSAVERRRMVRAAEEQLARLEAYIEQRWGGAADG